VLALWCGSAIAARQAFYTFGLWFKNIQVLTVDSEEIVSRRGTTSADARHLPPNVVMRKRLTLFAVRSQRSCPYIYLTAAQRAVFDLVHKIKCRSSY
jgi:hypothetical protein